MSRTSTFPVDLTDDFFAKTGPLPAAFGDARRFARFYYRKRVEALIHPVGDRKLKPRRTYLFARDLSRGGIGLIHIAPLVPGQRIDILSEGKPQLSATVVWCRYFADNFYAIGCRFEKRE